MKKQIFSLITALAVVGTIGGLAACSGGEEQAEHTEHNWVVDTENTVEATCGESGTVYYTCECGETKSEHVAATGNHSFGDGHVCSVCGYIDMSELSVDEGIAEYGFYHNDTDGSKTYTVGDTVAFGSYPQDLVENENTLSLLKDEEGTLPTTENAGDWNDYGYYSEGETASYMFYKDVSVDGVKYRGVYLLNYRPYYSELAAGADYSFIDDSFDLETVYWFEYSPIVWNVMSYENGSLFVSAVRCVEGQPFQTRYENSDGNLVIPGTDTYVNDWEKSTIRTFLNNDFYNLAFNSDERDLIKQVTLENKSYGTNTVSDTKDNVFLLSYSDIGVADYFVSANRTRTFTAYSTIQGLRPSGEASTADGEGACSYILRSAGSKSYQVAGVSKNGERSYGGNISLGSTDSYDNYAINGDLGILPALYLKIGK